MSDVFGFDIERVILASSSPRRRELLSRFGFPFTVDVSDVDENCSGHPAEMVKILSLRKASAVAAKYEAGIVIGSDTLVSLDGMPLGKPKDADDAYRMLRLLSGKVHNVYTGVTIIHAPTGKSVTFTDTSDICFRELSDAEIYDYIATGEPMDKAGAYAIQGGAGKFVSSYTGSFENIMGFPVQKFETECKAFLTSLTTTPEVQHG